MIIMTAHMGCVLGVVMLSQGCARTSKARWVAGPVAVLHSRVASQPQELQALQGSLVCCHCSASCPETHMCLDTDLTQLLLLLLLLLLAMNHGLIVPVRLPVQ